MIRIRWRWWLPSAQLALALAFLLLEAHQHRPQSPRNTFLGLEYAPQLFPAPAGRISQGINFPALVIDFPLRHQTRRVFEHDTEYAYVDVSLRDLGFFAGIVLFWYGVGRGLDSRRSRWASEHRAVRIAGPALGVAFAVLTGVYADYLIGVENQPDRQIGVCGIAWSCVLITLFAWQLAREFGAGTNVKRFPVTALGATFLVAILWIGGPYCAIQALGEYLRPSTLMKMPPPRNWNCSTSEVPPANLMQLVEAQRNLYQLTIQEVRVCREEGLRILLPPGEPDCDFGKIAVTDAAWLRLTTGCGGYQFRRHFMTLMATNEGNRAYIVEASLIQSRWDYLRLNWNKKQGSWFWPYEGTSERPRK